MTNIIQFQFNTQSVRTIADEHGEPWFAATDVCAVLGYRNAPDAVAKHCREKGIAKRDTLTSKGSQELTFINEGNLYRLIVKSRKPEAEKFEQLVMEEILPSIRKTGSYTAPKASLTPAQQRHIQNRVSELARAPGNSFASVWRSIKDQFKVGTYKDIPAEQYPVLCRFLLCKPLEGEWLEAETGTQPLELDFPPSVMLDLNPRLRGHEPDRFHLRARDLCGMDSRSPTLNLLAKLARAGYDVEGCKLEVLAMRHHLEAYTDLSATLLRLADSSHHGAVGINL